MADKYERYLMKEKMKEARHQAKMNALRRKKELVDIRNSGIQEPRPLATFFHIIPVSSSIL